uniref:Centrosomal protein of 97 kDa n=2 Tax=Latimeria chalumnae TaxID=7897 RepID=H3A6Z9_LATCH
EGPVVDLSGKSIQKLDPAFPCPPDTHTLILDKNQIIKLEHLEKCKGLRQLSVASNRLVRMMGVAKLVNIRVLNLPHNSIGYMEGLKDLVHLEWLNLSGNNIKTVDQINNCLSLRHLDLSDNSISQLSDFSKLVSLKTLLLHGNIITTLRPAPTHLPRELAILSLAENEIRDLNEISFLASAPELEQLSVMNNPCVIATPSLPGFDYRPYIISWCLNLKVLDGYVVSQKESLKAEWLYSQGKGRSHKPGQHIQLVQYLASVCPLTSASALQSEEDAKLEKILCKQRLHQRQLMQQYQKGDPPPSSTPNRALSVQTEQFSPAHSPGLSIDNEPVVHINSWFGTSAIADSSYTVKNFSPVSAQSRRYMKNDLFLEDIQTDEDKLNSSLLSSESTFMPVASGLSPGSSPVIELQLPEEGSELEANGTVLELGKQINNRESDDEKAEARIGKVKEHSANTKAEKEKETDTKDGSLPSPSNVLSSDNFTTSVCKFPASSGAYMGRSLPTGVLPGVETSGKSAFIERETFQQPTESSNLSKKDATDLQQLNRAATKIQSSWRGFYTRNYDEKAKAVRCEIRLRRMQEHIVFLTTEVTQLKRECKRERVQRLVQEEAVKFLWNQVRSFQQWQLSVNQQLNVLAEHGIPVSSTLSPPESLPNPSQQLRPQPLLLSTSSFVKGASTPTEKSSQEYPDSGFHSSYVDQSQLKDLSDSNGNSLVASESTILETSQETVKLRKEHMPENLVQGGGIDTSHADCSKDSSNSEQDSSLLQQYLNSVQQLEAIDDGGNCSDRTDSSKLQAAELPEEQDSLSTVASMELSHDSLSSKDAFKEVEDDLPNLNAVEKEEEGHEPAIKTPHIEVDV